MSLVRKVKRIVSACAALVVLLAVPAFALDSSRRLTQYSQRIWQPPQGLPQGSIFAIHQTRDGYLWLGTAEGLVRFDGVRFTSSNELEGLALPKVQVRQLTEDPRGRLWAATNGAGIFRIDDSTVANFSVRDGLPSDTIACLFQGEGSDLWACSGNSLARIRDGKIDVYRKAADLAGGKIEVAARRHDGTIWAGGEGASLSVWNGKQFVRYPLRTMPRNAQVQTLLSASDNTLWIGTTSGLIRLKDGQEQRFTRVDGLANDSVLSLAEGRNGIIWIGTDGGFSRWRDGDIESFLPNNGLSQSTVSAVFEDREGSLWAGTKRGLNQFVDRRTIPITTSEGLPSNNTGPVFQDIRGIIWVGTLGAGLGRFDGRRSSVLTKQDGLSSNSILTLAGDAADTLWVGTDAGLDRISNGRISKLLNGSIRSLYQDDTGTLWIGTSKGLFVLRAGKIQRLSGRDPVVSFVEDGGRILAALEGVGVKAYDKRTLQEIPGSSIAIRDADALYRDQDGRIWIGGIGSGLHFQVDSNNGGAQANISTKDGLFDDEIYGIVADDQDRLWLASSAGIFSVNRRDLLQFASGKITTVTSTPFSPLDGLQTVECKRGVQPAAWRMRDGGLAFSTIRGLIAINPGHAQLNFDPPPIVIENVAIDGRNQSPSKLRNLKPGDENLDFRYTALSLRATQRITFRYKLEGFDRDWVDAGQRRQAFYTNLKPGKYVFRVTGCNPDGACSESGATLAFTLPARLYQRTWFYGLCALLLALLARFAYVFRIRHIERQFGAILAERSRIARELHDTLLQGFSGVTMEMQGLAARLPNGSREALRDIIRDAANCLTEARRSVSELRRDRASAPGLAVALADSARQLTAPCGAHLKLAVERLSVVLPPYVEYNLLRIAQEAIINSVKHSGARTIEVSLQLLPNVLRIVVQDNGSGFGLGEPGADSFGLLGMKERARDIGADLRVKSEPQVGTRVVLDLAMKNASAEVARGVEQNMKAELENAKR